MKRAEVDPIELMCSKELSALFHCLHKPGRVVQKIFRDHINIGVKVKKRKNRDERVPTSKGAVFPIEKDYRVFNRDQHGHDTFLFPPSKDSFSQMALIFLISPDDRQDVSYWSPMER